MLKGAQGVIMYNVKQSACWTDSIENAIRENFISQITNNDIQKRNSMLTEMFITIFDQHNHSEEDFNNAILFTVEIMNNDDCNKIGQIAIDFYEQNKSLLMPETSQSYMSLEYSHPSSLADKKSAKQLEAKAEPVQEGIIQIQNAEAITTAAPIKWQMKVVEQLIEASTCPIDFEPMIKAVTLACGHSFNLEPAVQLFGKLNTSGRCQIMPCPSCRKEVSQYTDNDLLRKVAAKIATISASILLVDEDKGLTSQQIEMVKELKALLICPATLRPMSGAVAHSKGKYINEDASREIRAPVFSLREIATLAQNITTNTL